MSAIGYHVSGTAARRVPSRAMEREQAQAANAAERAVERFWDRAEAFANSVAGASSQESFSQGLLADARRDAPPSAPIHSPGGSAPADGAFSQDARHAMPAPRPAGARHSSRAGVVSQGDASADDALDRVCAKVDETQRTAKEVHRLVQRHLVTKGDEMARALQRSISDANAMLRQLLQQLSDAQGGPPASSTRARADAEARDRAADQCLFSNAAPARISHLDSTPLDDDEEHASGSHTSESSDGMTVEDYLAARPWHSKEPPLAEDDAGRGGGGGGGGPPAKRETYHAEEAARHRPAPEPESAPGDDALSYDSDDAYLETQLLEDDAPPAPREARAARGEEPSPCGPPRIARSQQDEAVAAELSAPDGAAGEGPRSLGGLPGGGERAGAIEPSFSMAPRMLRPIAPRRAGPGPWMPALAPARGSPMTALCSAAAMLRTSPVIGGAAWPPAAAATSGAGRRALPGSSQREPGAGRATPPCGPHGARKRRPRCPGSTGAASPAGAPAAVERAARECRAARRGTPKDLGKARKKRQARKKGRARTTKPEWKKWYEGDPDVVLNTRMRDSTARRRASRKGDRLQYFEKLFLGRKWQDEVGDVLQIAKVELRDFAPEDPLDEARILCVQASRSGPGAVEMVWTGSEMAKLLDEREVRNV